MLKKAEPATRTAPDRNVAGAVCEPDTMAEDLPTPLAVPHLFSQLRQPVPRDRLEQALGRGLEPRSWILDSGWISVDLALATPFSTHDIFEMQ